MFMTRAKQEIDFPDVKRAADDSVLGLLWHVRLLREGTAIGVIIDSANGGSSLHR